VARYRLLTKSGSLYEILKVNGKYYILYKGKKMVISNEFSEIDHILPRELLGQKVAFIEEVGTKFKINNTAQVVAIYQHKFLRWKLLAKL
jgi:hypothetical protein